MESVGFVLPLDALAVPQSEQLQVLINQVLDRARTVMNATALCSATNNSLCTKLGEVTDQAQKAEDSLISVAMEIEGKAGSFGNLEGTAKDLIVEIRNFAGAAEVLKSATSQLRNNLERDAKLIDASIALSTQARGYIRFHAMDLRQRARRRIRPRRF